MYMYHVAIPSSEMYVNLVERVDLRGYLLMEPLKVC